MLDVLDDDGLDTLDTDESVAQQVRAIDELCDPTQKTKNRRDRDIDARVKHLSERCLSSFPSALRTSSSAKDHLLVL